MVDVSGLSEHPKKGGACGTGSRGDTSPRNGCCTAPVGCCRVTKQSNSPNEVCTVVTVTANPNGGSAGGSNLEFWISYLMYMGSIAGWTEPYLIYRGTLGGGGGAGGTTTQPQSQAPAVCPTGSPNNHLSMGDSASVSTVNPFTSGNGGIWGGNRQSLGSPTNGYTSNNYTYSGEGFGLDIGASVQSVWAWGSGSWTGPFHSINVSFGPFSGSVFWTPGRGGWTGFSFGLGISPPIPQAAYEVTNYTCKSGPG